MSRTRIAMISILGASMLAIGVVAGAAAQDAGPMPPPPPQHGWGDHDGRGPWEHGPWEHIDGRIAYLRAELKITPQQEPAFKAVETVMRQHAALAKQQAETRRAEFEKRRAEFKTQGADHHEPHPPALTEALGHEQDMLTKVSKYLADYRAAVEPLYAELSPEQKAKADILLLPHHGAGHGPHGFGPHGGFGPER